MSPTPVAPSSPKWTNGQLLFHMFFGYLIVVRLLVLVRIFGRLPDGFSRRLAGVLEASTRPCHVINYLGSVGGLRLLGYAGMGRRFDRVIAKVLRRLERESDSELSRGMHYPTSWDPYFKAYMTLADVFGIRPSTSNITAANSPSGPD